MAPSRFINSEKESIYIPHDSCERFLPPSTLHNNILREQGIAMGGISTWSRDFRLERRHYPHHLILYTLGGSGLLRVDGREAVELGAGELLLAPPHSVYAYRTKGAHWESLWLHLHADSHLTRLIGSKPQVRPALFAEMLTRVIRGYIDEASLQRTDSVMAFRHYVGLISIYLQRELANAGPKHACRDNKLKSFLETVQKDLKQDWTISRMARLAGISRAQLHRALPRMTGKSPMQVVHSMRMERASELLIYTDRNLAVIAEEIGYDNQFSFSKAFKRHFGMSPSDFRKKTV